MPRECVLVHFSDDPDLWHLRIVLSDHGFVGEGERARQKVTVLTPGRQVVGADLGEPKFLEVVKFGVSWQRDLLKEALIA